MKALTHWKKFFELISPLPACNHSKERAKPILRKRRKILRNQNCEFPWLPGKREQPFSEFSFPNVFRQDLQLTWNWWYAHKPPRQLTDTQRKACLMAAAVSPTLSWSCKWQQGKNPVQGTSKSCRTGGLSTSWPLCRCAICRCTPPGWVEPPTHDRVDRQRLLAQSTCTCTCTCTCTWNT